MKTKRFLLLFLVFGILVTNISSAKATILADQIGTIIDLAKTMSESSVRTDVDLGQIFGIGGSYESILNSEQPYEIIQTKRWADRNNYDSFAIDSELSNYLDNAVTVGAFPDILGGLYPMSDDVRYVPYVYEYAKNGGNLTKWNITLAYQELMNCQNTSLGFTGFNPSNGAVEEGDRYYDENAQIVSLYVKLYQTGETLALSQANKLWDHLLSNHFTGVYFPYVGNGTFAPQVECAAGSFALIIGELAITNGFPSKDMIDFPDAILSDLDYKFTHNGDWSGRLWGSTFYYNPLPTIQSTYSVKHADQTPNEMRLLNTLIAWMALHAYYPLMNSTQKADFVKLLVGNSTQIPAWEGLINYSGLVFDDVWTFDSMTGGGTYDKTANICGALDLLLNGIIPNTGSLSMPMVEEYYQDWETAFSPQEWRFNYSNHSIRIPVLAGNIGFFFGSNETLANFPTNGVYDIKFDDTWNKVVSVFYVNQLSSKLTRLGLSNAIDELPCYMIDTLIIVSLFLVVCVFVKCRRRIKK